MRALLKRLFQRRRKPLLRSPEEALRSPEEALSHHIALLAYHDTGDSEFPALSKQFAEYHVGLVPELGQADTLQGEIVRMVNRLSGEDRRNGSMNWASGYQQFVTFLRDNLLDREIFSNGEIDQLSSDLRLVELNGTEGQNTGEVAVAFGRLIQAAATFCNMRPVPTKIPNDPNLKL